MIPKPWGNTELGERRQVAAIASSGRACSPGFPSTLQTAGRPVEVTSSPVRITHPYSGGLSGGQLLRRAAIL